MLIPEKAEAMSADGGWAFGRLILETGVDMKTSLFSRFEKRPPFEVANGNVELLADPINAEWILEGTPIARSAIISRNADGGAYTVIWECTSGRFNWFYRDDETIYVLEGSVLLSSESGEGHRLGPGNTAHFPAGSLAVWSVDFYVRKVAFYRTPLPRQLMFAIRAARRLARMVGASG